MKGRIIGMANQKGGVGKSTIACMLAGGLANRFPNDNVLLVNADKNKSVTMWANLRDQLNEDLVSQGKKPLAHIDSVQLPRENYINRQLNSFRDKYDWIVVDSGGHDNKAFQSLLLTADLIYVPIQPSAFDLYELEETLEQIEKYEQLGNSVIDARLILSRSKGASQARKTEAREFCAQLIGYASLSSACIKELAVYQDCQKSGESLHDIRSNHRGSIDLLIDEITGERKVAMLREVGA